MPLVTFSRLMTTSMNHRHRYTRYSTR